MTKCDRFTGDHDETERSNMWTDQKAAFLRQGASWCTGMTLRDGMGREVGGRTHVHPWLIHVNVWQKPPQY